MLPYKQRQLRALGEVEELVTLALAKMTKFPGMYLGDIRDVRDIIRVKLKLEDLQRKIKSGHKIEKNRYERSSTRTNPKE